MGRLSQDSRARHVRSVQAPGWRGGMAGALVWALVSAGSTAVAHPDVWHSIELITGRIDGGDHRAALYYARATEYRIVEKWGEAEADLRICLQRDSSFFPARLDLGPVLLSAGRPLEALVAAHDAVSASTEEPAARRASAWAAVARIERARHHWSEVLAATEQALHLAPRGEVDWYLMREQAFRAQGRLSDAIDDLARGEARLHSTLIRGAWIDALIDATRGKEALPLIDTAMADTRHQSPWLIRRGNAHASQGNMESARADWQAALSAVEARLVPEEPDPGLLVEKGLALAALGRTREAEVALTAARTLFPDPVLLGPLERALTRSEPPPPAVAPSERPQPSRSEPGAPNSSHRSPPR